MNQQNKQINNGKLTNTFGEVNDITITKGRIYSSKQQFFERTVWIGSEFFCPTFLLVGMFLWDSYNRPFDVVKFIIVLLIVLLLLCPLTVYVPFIIRMNRGEKVRVKKKINPFKIIASFLREVIRFHYMRLQHNIGKDFFGYSEYDFGRLMYYEQKKALLDDERYYFIKVFLKNPHNREKIVSCRREKFYDRFMYIFSSLFVLFGSILIVTDFIADIIADYF